MSAGTVIFGPLVEPECRRALGRGWLILVRTLAALAVLAITLIFVWYCWVCASANPYYLPYGELRNGLWTVEAISATVALVLAPAVLAGSLAGEKERGALGLLLTTRVSGREIVAARFAGKLTQVGMILLAGLPATILFAALTGMNADVIAMLLLLPAALAFGSAGLSAGVSAVSRRGRDALLTVYLIQILFLLSPIVESLVPSLSRLGWAQVLNPYASLGRLVYEEDLAVPLLSVALWSALGAGGLVVASLRLAPACLGQLDGARIGRRVGRRSSIPRIDERPMLWKELYVERAGTLGGFGWWVGAALTLVLVAGSLAMAGVMAWDALRNGDLAWFNWAQAALGTAVRRSSYWIAWLIEWAVGLRAAVSIASERERGTWDAILTSPLEGKDIIRAKLWGALHALRWLFAAALLAWTLAAVTGGLSPEDYVSRVIGTVLGAGFMAAVGLRASLASATATRAMAVTIGVWLGSLIAVTIIAGILSGVVMIVLASAAAFADGATMLTSMRWVVSVMPIVNIVTANVPYLIFTPILVSHIRLQFDRLAGRRAGGRLAVAADRFLHGAPVRSVVNDREPAHSGASGSGASLSVGQSDPA